ncbi:DivIVA domain-containing protein [Actinoplanes awajinensis]|uniref:Cell division initiation protein n=1 Tax=Actinoplanes awajinensis subsp. mycoplanecinus TaxID=135947 RepID=A0A0X3UVW2_9ACTN|nr:hypothetical protein [Actinoplanes awajinensis]KUL36688.1 hypothetical protein ADL15_12695 [Actinoplanes awajinensis subsp. mycoplanecinus]
MTTDAEVLLPRSDVDGVSVSPAMLSAQRDGAEAETLILPGGALEVLALAQRTADDHVAEASRRARKVQAEAEVRAEQIHRDACAYADEIRAEADRLLTDARAEAQRIVAGGSDFAEELRLRAEQQYEDAVGGLSIKREALQKQIEALSTFDSDYRQRITSFLQSQLRALWAEQPRTGDMPDIEMQVPGGPVGSLLPN